MVKVSGWGAALALAAAACSSDDAPTSIDCAWLARDNCWKASAAAATACTDGAATGALDATWTTCSYDDGAAVLFDPSASLSVSLAQPELWNFTVVSSTATTCARYVQNGLTSGALTTRLGTLSLMLAGDPILLTCPDGSRFAMARDVAATCADLAGWTATTYHATGTTEFRLNGAPEGDDVLWRCR
jgi:hypothetical protein